MSAICIQVINPNTSLTMTETISAAACAIVAPGTEILTVRPRAGVPSTEGHFDGAIATIGVLEQIKAGREQGADGHVIACFGDPGLLTARELAQGPMIGTAEAAMRTATMVATRFSIVTTLSRTLIITHHLLHQYGFRQHYTALHAIDLPVLALKDGSGLVQERVCKRCIRALKEDGSGVIVPSCGGMTTLTQELAHELRVPVVDGVSAAVKMAESLVALSLATSKHGDLVFPERKALSGQFQSLNLFQKGQEMEENQGHYPRDLRGCAGGPPHTR